MKESESNSPSKPSPMNPPGQHHPDGALEDPLHEWWQKNGKSLIAGAVIVVLGTGLIFGLRAYRQSQETALQVAFNEAVATDSLGSYALENAGHPLGGVAALQTANAAFEAGEWDRAHDFYSLAVDALKGSPLQGKARLGVAISESKQGNDAAAEQVLATLADDQNAFPAARAEALYFLSLLALSADDRAAFDRWSGKLSEIDQAGRWSSRLNYYEDRTPLPVREPAPEDGTGQEAETTGEAPADQTPAEDSSPMPPEAPGDAAESDSAE